MGGVDALTGRFALPCPERGTVRVRLSSFRAVDRVTGTAHPAVYAVAFACDCGSQHEALVTHDDLDWGTLGFTTQGAFLNLMTARHDDLASELTALATARIDRGEWPWCFFCYLEDAARPATPSAFRRLVPGDGGVTVAVVCPCCGSASVNRVSRSHVDVPFHSDPRVEVATQVLDGDALPSFEGFRAGLESATFDPRHLTLASR